MLASPHQSLLRLHLCLRAAPTEPHHRSAVTLLSLQLQMLRPTMEDMDKKIAKAKFCTGAVARTGRMTSEPLIANNMYAITAHISANTAVSQANLEA